MNLPRKIPRDAKVFAESKSVHGCCGGVYIIRHFLLMQEMKEGVSKEVWKNLGFLS